MARNSVWFVRLPVIFVVVSILLLTLFPVDAQSEELFIGEPVVQGCSYSIPHSEGENISVYILEGDHSEVSGGVIIPVRIWVTDVRYPSDGIDAIFDVFIPSDCDVTLSPVTRNEFSIICKTFDTGGLVLYPDMSAESMVVGSVGGNEVTIRAGLNNDGMLVVRGQHTLSKGTRFVFSSIDNSEFEQEFEVGENDLCHRVVNGNTG